MICYYKAQNNNQINLRWCKKNEIQAITGKKSANVERGQTKKNNKKL